MSVTPTWQAAYTDALRRYLDDPGASSLAEASTLGRAALERGEGIREVVGAHLEAVAASPDDASRSLRFLAGCLGAFELVHARSAEVIGNVLLAHQQAIARLGDAALSERDNLERLAERAVEAVSRELGVDVAEVALTRADGSLALAASVGLDASPGTVIPGGAGSHAGYTVRAEEPVVLDDVATETRFVVSDVLRSAGVVSGVTVAIGTSDEPYGVLGAHTRRRRRFAAEEVSFLQSIANVLGAAERRSAAERSAALLAEQHDAMLQTTTDGFLLVDREGRILDVNEAYSRMSGYSAAELLEKRIWDLEAFADERSVSDGIRRCVVAGFDRFETQHTTKSEELLELDVGISYVPGQDRVLLFARDIGARKHAERKARESRDRLELAQLAAGMGVFDWDVVSGDVTWTEALERIYGFPAGGFGGRYDDWRERVHPDDRDEAEASVARSIEAHADWQTTYRIVRPDGETRWIEARGRPYYDASGAAMRFVGVNVDVTAGKLASDELDRFFRLALELLCVASIDGHFLRVNPAFEHTLGYSRDELLATPFLDFVHPDDRAATIGAVADLAEERDVVHFVNRYRCKDGSYRWLEWSSRAVADQGLIYAAARDVTDARARLEEIRVLNMELEERVAVRTAELVASNAELEAFAYSVSHDLRAPLRSMDGFSKLLLDDYADRLDERGRDFAGRIRAGAQRLGAMIDDLLMLSRVSGAELRRTRLDLSGLVRTALDELRETQPARRVEELVAEGAWADADPELVRVLLDNLLDNAWKFTSTRDVARIEFGTAGDSDEPAFFVRDNGVGFDMAYVGKLFQPFERLHRTDEFPGTGIGLASVRRIVGRHGGRVWAEAAPDAGATFSFTLAPKGAPR